MASPTADGLAAAAFLSLVVDVDVVAEVGAFAWLGCCLLVNHHCTATSPRICSVRSCPGGACPDTVGWVVFRYTAA